MTDPDWVVALDADIDSEAAAIPNPANSAIRVSSPPSDKWLADAWSKLPERQREIMVRRAEGETLEEIGTHFSVSRERVRQLQRKADEAIAAAVATYDRGLDSRLAAILGDSTATGVEELAAELPAAPEGAQRALLGIFGIHHPNTWDGKLIAWWTRMPNELDRRLTAVVHLAPLSHSEFSTALGEVGLSYRPPVTALLDSSNSKLRQSALGWYRPARIGRDLAFLYLQSQGSPRSIAEVAAVTGLSLNATRESMRRDNAFAQVRPEGTWALTDWRVPGSDNRYSNAEETVVEVVRDLGPVSLAELRREVQQRYPVSAWRIKQCLSSAMIGLTLDGRYDLAERGAIPIEDAEPKQPETIETQGHIIGVQLSVNRDLLRGSGITVNRWLTWRLGLRIVPSLRVFELDSGGQVTIKRASSSSQISSLRTAVQHLDIGEGCKIALILNTDSNTGRIHHICTWATCPAFV